MMAIVDERGRVFGRWNLLDLSLLVLLFGLIPLGYGAFVLFRDRPPRVTGVEPTQLRESDAMILRIKGENLRPYNRLSLGPYQGREFLFRSTEEAEIPFSGVPPGEYDVILYDQAQERHRLPHAVTVMASALPATQLVAIGAIGNLEPAAAAKLTAATQLRAAEIVSIGKPLPDSAEVYAGSKLVGVMLPNAQRVPAVIKFNCFVRIQAGTPYCTYGDVTIASKSVLLLQAPSGSVPFQVQRVRSVAPLQSAKVTLHVNGHPAVLSAIKVGDVDLGGADTDLEVLARVTSVSPLRSLGATSELDVTLSVSVQRANGAWLYDSLPLRLGSALALRTKGYELNGVIRNIEPPPQ